MTEKISNIYRSLQLHLDQFPIGLPATKSSIELKVLRHVFTEEEALLATKLDWSYKTLEEIYENVKNEEIWIESLEEILENMVKKGTIKYKFDNDKKLYKNIPLVVGIFEYQVNKLTKEFLNDFEEYLLTAFGAEVLGTKIFQFRTIPIDESIAPEHYIAHYDEIEYVINNVKHPIGVTNCACRQAKDLFDQPCNQTSLRETCMYFGKTGQLFIDQGWARSISKEEAIELLKNAEKDGLVIQSGNTTNPEFICCCCGCCCQILMRLKMVPRPARILAANYYAEINSELCSGCGTCVEHCQLNAIKIVDNSAKLILKRCIGCGVCVPTCPEQAIQLKKRDTISIPPQSKKELYTMIMDKKQEIKSKNK